MAGRRNLDELRTLVRDKGLRATPSRLAVLELLRATDAPTQNRLLRLFGFSALLWLLGSRDE